jgi:hypothetical protein
MSAPSLVSSATNPPYPLSGITVLDLSHVYNGPYAAFLMALAGATVIKIEPLHGEHLRSRGDLGGADLPFAMLNSRAKKAATFSGSWWPAPTSWWRTLRPASWTGSALVPRNCTRSTRG